MRLHRWSLVGGWAAAAGCAVLPLPGPVVPAPPAPAVVTPAATAAAPPLSLPTCDYADFEARVLERVNHWRLRGAVCGARGRFPPAPPLRWSPALAQAAAGHALDMAARDSFSHRGAGGSSVSDRVLAAGYAWRRVGENIAAGYTSPAGVVDGWIASPPHCAALMEPAFVDVGVACAPADPPVRYLTYWTMNLGAR